MKRPRALRWSCHALVAVWAVGLFAQADRGLDAPLPEPRARVRPVTAQPPAEPEPAREPLSPSQPEPTAAPAARAVGEAERVHGAALLDAGGEFPALSFGYDAFPSFRSYASAMAELGARFVVVRRRQIVGSIDVESRAIETFAEAAAFSPRARDYTGEPELAGVARVARERFGDRAVVMMLVPRALDVGLFGGLARLVAERGERHERLREIRGRYERGPDGRLRLRVEAAVRRDGTEVPVEALFDLTQIGGAART